MLDNARKQRFGVCWVSLYCIMIYAFSSSYFFFIYHILDVLRGEMLTEERGEGFFVTRILRSELSSTFAILAVNVSLVMFSPVSLILSLVTA